MGYFSIVTYKKNGQLAYEICVFFGVRNGASKMKF